MYTVVNNYWWSTFDMYCLLVFAIIYCFMKQELWWPNAYALVTYLKENCDILLVGSLLAVIESYTISSLLILWSKSYDLIYTCFIVFTFRVTKNVWWLFCFYTMIDLYATFSSISRFTHYFWSFYFEVNGPEIEDILLL